MYEREPMIGGAAAPSSGVAAPTQTDSIPDLALRSATICAAYLLARDAHPGPGHGGIEPSHPVAVAELLAAAGFGENEICAALLQDTVEDTALSIEQIEASFGGDVSGLVAGLTEDSRIDRYPARKAEARARAIQDRRVAAIYAADKLANTRRLLDDCECVEGERLDHYVKTLRLFFEQTPRLPFLPELSAELTRLIDRDAGRVGAPTPDLRRGCS
jgi:(p)ppGpp synthase/HD superfamily hydrolase